MAFLNQIQKNNIDYDLQDKRIPDLSQSATGQILSIKSDKTITPITLPTYDLSTKLDKNNPSGSGSFSLNRNTSILVGTNSFIEGNNCSASGNYAHSEGQSTIAAGINSHSEGLQTSASSQNQHVQGKNNIIDNHNIFADIIGNGISLDNKADAYAMDWNGNAYISGNIYANCNAYTTTSSGLSTPKAGGRQLATVRINNWE